MACCNQIVARYTQTHINVPVASLLVRLVNRPTGYQIYLEELMMDFLPDQHIDSLFSSSHWQSSNGLTFAAFLMFVPLEMFVAHSALF